MLTILIYILLVLTNKSLQCFLCPMVPSTPCLFSFHAPGPWDKSCLFSDALQWKRKTIWTIASWNMKSRQHPYLRSLRLTNEKNLYHFSIAFRMGDISFELILITQPTSWWVKQSFKQNCGVQKVPDLASSHHRRLGILSSQAFKILKQS